MGTISTHDAQLLESNELFAKRPEGGLGFEMQPLKSDLSDAEALQQLGLASVQIVHDLKNQLNGLKLYATFLRKRMERNDRPADEQETVAKLIAGLERSAAQMTLLVRFGRSLELKRQPGANLVKILTSIAEAEGVTVAMGAERIVGAFDVAALTEALRNITGYVAGLAKSDDGGEPAIHAEVDDELREATIEWRGWNISSSTEPLASVNGTGGLRMSLASKIIKAHGGEVSHDAGALRVKLPIG